MCASFHFLILLLSSSALPRCVAGAFRDIERRFELQEHSTRLLRCGLFRGCSALRLPGSRHGCRGNASGGFVSSQERSRLQVFAATRFERVTFVFRGGSGFPVLLSFSRPLVLFGGGRTTRCSPRCNRPGFPCLQGLGASRPSVQCGLHLTRSQGHPAHAIKWFIPIRVVASRSHPAAGRITPSPLAGNVALFRLAAHRCSPA